MGSRSPTRSSPALRSGSRGSRTWARCAAANYAWCNRQLLTHQAREVFARVLATPWETLGMDLVYDVAHNIAKFEHHEIGGGVSKQVCVHRKGATRAFLPVIRDPRRVCEDRSAGDHPGMHGNRKLGACRPAGKHGAKPSAPRVTVPVG